MIEINENQDNLDRQVGRLVSLCLKANKYAAEDPEVSLMQARKAAEAICLQIFSREIGNPGKIMLNDLIGQLGSKKVLPRRIMLPLSTIQSYGNYGSHHQDDCFEVDSEFVIPCLSALKQVLEWYFLKYLDTEVPNDIKGFIKSSKQSTYSEYRLDKNTRTNFKPIQEKYFSVFSSPSRHLPIDALTLNKNSLTLMCPCDLTLAYKANQMTSVFYGSEAIPFELYEQWRIKNPQILVCLTAPDNEVLGYFDVFPLKDVFLEDFIEGRLGEDELKPEYILSPDESIFSCQLYLGGIAVKSPNTFAGSRNAAILLWGLLHYLKTFYPGKRARMLYALGSTFEGDELLRRFNFTVLSSENERVDKHNFYALPFTPLLLDEYLSLLQDWSGICDISWHFRSSNIPKSSAS